MSTAPAEVEAGSRISGRWSTTTTSSPSSEPEGARWRKCALPASVVMNAPREKLLVLPFLNRLISSDGKLTLLQLGPVSGSHQFTQEPGKDAHGRPNAARVAQEGGQVAHIDDDERVLTRTALRLLELVQQLWPAKPDRRPFRRLHGSSQQRRLGDGPRARAAGARCGAAEGSTAGDRRAVDEDGRGADRSSAEGRRRRRFGPVVDELRLGSKVVYAQAGGLKSFDVGYAPAGAAGRVRGAVLAYEPNRARGVPLVDPGGRARVRLAVQ